MATAEPALAALHNPLLRYFLATRPAFLSVTVCGYLIGLVAVYADGIALAPAAARGYAGIAVAAYGWLVAAAIALSRPDGS